MDDNTHNNRVLALAATSVLLFLALHLFRFLVRTFWADPSGAVQITLYLLIGAFLVLFLLGVAVGFAARKFGLRLTEGEIKTSVGGVLGATFVGGLCLSGVCIPAAAIGAFLAVPLLVPALLGMKFVSLRSSK